MRGTAAKLLLVAALLAPACQSPEDAARVAFSGRLKQEARLTSQEVARLFDYIAPAIAGKSLEVRQGAITRRLDEERRLSVLGMLSDPTAVYDGGLKVENGATWRSIKGGATPPQSELDATQTLWIDADTFEPRRYDFEYSLPGFGDYSYDLIFTK